MANLIPLEQAAAILGLSVEQITELRSQNEIFGYRDGSSWKFKPTELERVASALDLKLNKKALQAAAQSGSDSGLDFHEGAKPKIMSDDESSADMIGDSSEDNLIQEDSSVEIFSKPISGVKSALGSSDSGLNLEESVEDLKLHGSGEVLSDDKNEDDLAFGSSDLSLAAGSSKKLAGDDVFDDLEESEGSPSDTGKMLGGGDDMLLSEEDLFSDELSIADSGSFEDSAELSSDFEDSDLVMEDSDSSTEVVLEANESGINLSPNESGISLDDSLELGGSDIDSLELPEDDDIIMLENPADDDAVTIMQEDDFNLTPLEEAMEDESTGSQVIALEDSEIYADESSPTILGESNESLGEPSMLEDSLGFDTDAYAVGGLAPAGMPLPGGAAAMPVAPYTVWQVVSLGLVTVLLSLGLMIGYDMARNMWMPNDQVLNSGVLKMFLDLFRMG